MSDELRIKHLEEENKKLKQEIALLKADPTDAAYFAFQRIINQQVDYLGTFSIKDKIGGKASEDATFARTQGIWENLPKMISALSELKSLRKSNESEQKESVKSNGSITAENVADVLGNSAGQRN